MTLWWWHEGRTHSCCRGWETNSCLHTHTHTCMHAFLRYMHTTINVWVESGFTVHPQTERQGCVRSLSGLSVPPWLKERRACVREGGGRRRGTFKIRGFDFAPLHSLMGGGGGGGAASSSMLLNVIKCHMMDLLSAFFSCLFKINLKMKINLKLYFLTSCKKDQNQLSDSK